MGSGRKKKIPLLEKAVREWTINCSVTARNLSKSELGGVIFGCKNFTIEECKKNNLFGLPSGHFSYVKNVTPGMVLFLFNYSDRKLHGIYEAISPGQLNINPRAWTGNDTELTAYPAQVRVRVRSQCRSLYEEQFGPVIANNYNDSDNPNLFWFELDQAQCSKLIDLFLASALPRSLVPKNLPIPGVKGTAVESIANISHEVDKEREIWEQTAANLNPEGECSYASVLRGTNHSLPQKPSWSSLFKSSSASESISSVEDPKAQSSTLMPLSYHSNGKWEVTHIPSSPDREDRGHKGCADQWDTEITVTAMRKESEIIQSKASEMDLYNSGEPNTERQLSCALQVSPLEALRENDARYINTDLGSSLKNSGTQPFDFRSMIYLLMQEFEELKASQLKQNLKISSLEQKIQSMGETQSFEKHFEMFNSRPTSSSSVYFEEVFLDAHEFLAQSDDSIIVIGGHDGSRWLSDLSLYSPTYDLVETREPMTFLRSFSSVVQLNGEVYLLGGLNVNAGTWYNTVESYNVMHDKWFKRPSLNEKKGGLAGVSVHDKLYAIGGGNGINCYSEVEMLDMNIGEWIFAKSMQQKRYGPTVATINDILYVVGGYDGNNYLKSVERLDPREPKWTRLQSMSTARGCHSLAVFNEKLYALGGYDGQKILSTVEIFDPRVCSWMVGEPMKGARGYSSSVVFGGKIYAIGGMNGDREYLGSIEYYEEGAGWTMTNLKALGKRSFCSALVL